MKRGGQKRGRGRDEERERKMKEKKRKKRRMQICNCRKILRTYCCCSVEFFFRNVFELSTESHM